jgi:Tfp pilus assembly protein PilX
MVMKTDLHSLTNIKPTPHRQEGAVLIVALVLLVVLTMLGISAVESTKLETRMAASTRDYNRAFQAAEANLIQAVDIFKSLDSIENISQNPNSSSESPVTGNANVNITKSATVSYTGEDGKNIIYHHFFIESTGFSQEDETNALQVKLVEGRRIKGTVDNNVLLDED